MAVAPFQIVPMMQAVARMYFNANFIADEVLPRVSTNGTKEFQYPVWALERNFTVPDTLVGRISSPNRIEDKWTLETDVCADYGLDHPIPVEDIMNAAAGMGIDLRANAAQFVTWLVLLAREVRVANLIFNSSNYGSGLFATLTGTDQWTDKTNSTPLDDSLFALSEPYLRPNRVVFGLDAWNSYRVHPQIVQAIRGAVNPGNNAATAGIVNTSDVAQLLGVERVLVGDGRVNLAVEGETPNIQRVYNDSVAFLHINTAARTVNDRIPTWGWTAQFGDRVAGTVAVDMGLMGGELARVGESVKEKVLSPHAGYLLLDTNA